MIASRTAPIKQALAFVTRKKGIRKDLNDATEKPRDIHDGNADAMLLLMDLIITNRYRGEYKENSCLSPNMVCNYTSIYMFSTGMEGGEEEEERARGSGTNSIVVDVTWRAQSL